MLYILLLVRNDQISVYQREDCVQTWLLFLKIVVLYKIIGRIFGVPFTFLLIFSNNSVIFQVAEVFSFKVFGSL